MIKKCVDKVTKTVSVRFIALLPPVALLLAGCASNEANPAPCPAAVILNDAARFIEFDGTPNVESIAYSGEMRQVTTSCRYYDDEPIRAKLVLELEVGRGPQGETARKTIPYFVAVTRHNRAVLFKEEFTAEVRIGEVGDTESVTEQIEQILIPRADETISGANFEIVVGFALNEDQIAWNRSGESLRFPDL